MHAGNTEKWTEKKLHREKKTSTELRIFFSFNSVLYLVCERRARTLKNLSLLQKILCPFFFYVTKVCIECVHEIRTIDLARELDRLDYGYNSAANANAQHSTNSTSNPFANIN